MTALEIARAKVAEMRENGEYVARKTWREKLEENPTSRSLAINAMCWECAGSGADGNGETKKIIAECVVDCPLHSFRPYK